MGMGGAFVALADDTSAIMFNPAGLGQIDKAQVTAAYDRLYAGLGDDNLGRGLVSYVQPSQHYGAFALNLSLLNVPLYKETTVAFGYGRSFGPAYLGLSVKGLFANFEENDYTRLDPLFNEYGTSTNEMALDLGFLYKLSDSMSFGLAALNVNQPNMALDEDADAEVPLTLQTGIALKLGSTVPTIDFTYRNKDLGDGKDINLHFGIESWLAGRSMALRAGVNFYDMAVGASYAFGKGKGVDARLDYAFRYPLVFKEDAIGGTYGTHQFSLNVGFGGLTAAHGSEKLAEGAEMEEAQAQFEADADELIEKAIACNKDGKYKEGVKLCEEILGMEFSSVPGYHLEAHMLAGNMMNQLGQHKEALKHLQTAVKMDSRDPRTHYELAMFYKQTGDRTGSMSWYNKAIIEFEKTRMIDSGFKDVSAQLVTLKKKR